MDRISGMESFNEARRYGRADGIYDDNDVLHPFDNAPKAKRPDSLVNGSFDCNLLVINNNLLSYKKTYLDSITGNE